MGKPVNLPANIFDHPVFRHKQRLRYFGAYAWLCANQPVRAPTREIGALWRMPHNKAMRILQSLQDAGLIYRERLDGRAKRFAYYVTPWRRIPDFERLFTDGTDNSIRKKVFSRDGYRCVYCGSGKELEVDHVEPKAKGGATILTNLVTACVKCNRSKWARSPSEWKRGNGESKGLHRDLANHIRSPAVPDAATILAPRSLGVADKCGELETGSAAEAQRNGGIEARPTHGEPAGTGGEMAVAEVECGLFPAAPGSGINDYVGTGAIDHDQDSDPDSV